LIWFHYSLEISGRWSKKAIGLIDTHFKKEINKKSMLIEFEPTICFRSVLGPEEACTDGVFVGRRKLLYERSLELFDKQMVRSY
jgi:hypothetical protein